MGGNTKEWKRFYREQARIANYRKSPEAQRLVAEFERSLNQDRVRIAKVKQQLRAFFGLSDALGRGLLRVARVLAAALHVDALLLRQLPALRRLVHRRVVEPARDYSPPIAEF